MSERPGSWMRDHLANERTLMAWARTSLALVAVGLGVAKLATFLEIAAVDHPELASQLPSPFWSELLGVLLVGFGFMTLLVGAVRTWRWARHVDGDPPRMLGLWLMTGVYLAISVGVGAYIVLG